MRMVTGGKAMLAVALLVVSAAPALAQRRATAAPAAPAGPAPLAGRWAGTYTNDMTSKGGQLVLTLAGSDESAAGVLALTPTGARGPVLPEGAVAPARGSRAPAGLPVTVMKSGEDQVSGNVDAAYVDPGCNCTVITTIEATLSGSTMTGTLSARDSKTGQWNSTSFTARKGTGR